jgi:anti-anti-sigma factor
MLHINISTIDGHKSVNLNGRVDALSANELEKEFEGLTLTGERYIIVNFTDVSYISSAGLRIFLLTQKKLKKIGGELILFNIAESVREVFKVSGFDQVFRIIKSFDELSVNSRVEENQKTAHIATINNISVEVITADAAKGKLKIIGSQEKQNSSSYTKDDVVQINNSEFKFGTGLAALGNDYDEYKGLFGESMIIDGNFYSYPAIKKSAVDFILSNEISAKQTYKFLHGFGFSGSYSCLIKFNRADEYVNLNEIIDVAGRYAKGNLFGIVIIAESGGIMGMHLKQIPIAENKPPLGNIFDQQNFSSWLDFPLEPINTDNIIAAVGIAVKDKNILQPEYKQLFSSDSDFHIHAGIFEKGSLNKNLVEFDVELKRILSELQINKIQHLLGQSKFKSGIASIIELEAE